MAMLVKNLTCSNCGSPLKSKEADLVLFCSHCGSTMEFMDNDCGPVQLHILAPKAEKDVIYVPFWQIDAEISVEKLDTTHGFLERGSEPLRGPQRFYVAAAETVAEGWNGEFTRNPPITVERTDFGSFSHVAATKTSRAAEMDAEFLFLKQEVEAAGTLQDIEYTFRIVGHAVVYIPFVVSKNGYSPAF